MQSISSRYIKQFSSILVIYNPKTPSIKIGKGEFQKDVERVVKTLRELSEDGLTKGEMLIEMANWIEKIHSGNAKRKKIKPKYKFSISGCLDVILEFNSLVKKHHNENSKLD